MRHIFIDVVWQKFCNPDCTASTIERALLSVFANLVMVLVPCTLVGFASMCALLCC